MTKPIPDGYYNVTPTLTIKGTLEAIEFHKKAFVAQEIYRFPGLDGKSIMHAEIKMGDSKVMLCDEIPQMCLLSPKSTGGASGPIYLYVQNSDDIFNKALSARAKTKIPLMDGFWGDRIGTIEYPHGHIWTIATHKKDMSIKEIRKAGEEFIKNF